MTHPTFDWLDDLPLVASSPDLRMGIRPLDISGWLPVDELTELELGRRRRVFMEHPEFVQMQPGHETALEELLSLVGIHIGDRLVSDGSPMERLALSVPDDIVLMHKAADAEPGDWRLVGGAVLFPNQWTLGEKIGRHVTEIHERVDGYDQLLARRVGSFFDGLSAKRPVWRRNWFIHDDPNLVQPFRTEQRPISDPDEVDSLWVRSEWQTLRRLVFSGLIVFTIKSQIAPMSAVCDRPHIAEQLATFLSEASDRSLANKDAVDRHHAIIEYLRRS